MSSPTPQSSRTPSEASAAIGGSPTSAEASAGGVASGAGLPAPAGAPAGASEDSYPSAASRSTSTSASASASGASSSLLAPVGRANESSVPSAATSSSPTSASAQASGASGTLLAAGTTRVSAPPTDTNPVSASSMPTPSVWSPESSMTTFTGQPSVSAQSGSRSEGSSSTEPVPALPPMHAIIPMPLPRYIRLEELSSVVNEASETTVREGTRAVADNLDVSFESLARLMVHLAREPPLRFNPDLDERLERAEGLQAVVNAVVPPADASPGRDEELAALVDECEDLRFPSGERNVAQDELRRVRGELLAANRELGPIRSALDNSTQMVANLRVQLRDKDRGSNAVHLQHRVDRSDYRAAVAKYSAEVAQLNRLLQSSATPVSPSAQPAGASHGSPRSPSSRPTNPGKRPLSKSSAAGLSLAAAGLGSSSSDSEDSGPRKPSAKRHRLSQGKPSHPHGSPSGPSAGKSQLPASKRLVRPAVDLRAKAGSSKASSPLLPGSQSPASASHASLALTQQSSAPSEAATSSPPGPRPASPAAPEVVNLLGDDQVDEAPTSVDTSHEISLSTPKRRDGRPTREASVTASLRSKASLEELLASDDLVLVPAPTDASAGVLTGSLGSGSASSAPPPPPRHGRSLPYQITATLDHAGHQPERVYACDVASATSGVEGDAAANLGQPRWEGSVGRQRHQTDFEVWERGHCIPIGAIDHWLDAFAQEVGEDSAEFQAILAAWIEFDRARNLRADRYPQQVPHRYWDWAIRPSSDPAHIPPELMLEPTILIFSFEVILWIPKTADWVSEVSVVDERQPWRNCWIDVPGQHPFNTTFAPCNPPVPLFVPRGFTRQQVIDDIMLNPQLSVQEIISPWAVELLNRRTQPGTPPPASPAAPVDDESKVDSPQSSVAAAAALVGSGGSCVVYW
ncbi:unnamed protein product [Phytophthora lilii]|uniref:Unnamed protein product n=1 Tax=Phytophthora lilii TaxID=2077276 RepID=A0A9W6XCH3_9STRA|nr:unnamed protein product [Phytophthora lilii]